MAGVIDIAVVDDDRMLLDGLGSWLARQQRLRLVGTAATVGELLARPGAAAEVVLLDLVLRDGSDPEANVRRVRAAGSRVLLIRPPRITTAIGWSSSLPG